MGGQRTCLSIAFCATDAAMHLLGSIASLALLLALNGCSSSDTSTVLPISLTYDPPICTVGFDNRSFSLPSDETALFEELKVKRRKYHKVSVINDKAMPFRCIGHAVFIAQRAGFKDVQSTIDPTPSPPRQ